jgi:LPS-assembly protein
MLLTPRPLLQARSRRLPPLRAGAVALAALALGWSLPAMAGPAASTSDSNPPPAQDDAKGERQIAFEANELQYDSNRDVLTASGDVVMRSGNQSVRADSVSWDRKANEITASGNIRFVDGDGNVLYSDTLSLTGDLKLGAMSNMLLALRAGGRLAANSGERDQSGNVVLSHATYSACAVENESGCPKTPSWRIVAKRVIYDPESRKVRFKGAQLELFGARLLPLPGLVVTTDGRAISGLTIPNPRISASNGVELSQGYYIRLADNQDLTVTGYVYTQAPPMVSAQYRVLTGSGAFQLSVYGTRSGRIPSGPQPGSQLQDWRGYFFANGKFQFSPEWSLTASARVASDRTFLRRYDISRDDRLRSTFNLERIDDNSYFSIQGWATQTLRFNDPQGQVPIALPLIDYRHRFDDPVLGGRFELQVNSLAITRTQGQDTQRAFLSGRWDLSGITSMGQQVTLTALVRGDVYHSDQNMLTATEIYRGNPGWEARGVAIGAIDVKWPFVGSFLGGTQVITPRFQIVASPPIKNLAVPNEDARAIDLEDSNLFALNRFPGYDRIEDGTRFTYGFDWQFNWPGWSIKATVGQSYRLTSEPTLLPDGTGLSGQVSDFVGRTEVRYKDFIKLTHRFRLDKDSLAVRRNEFDATIGSSKTYAEFGYLMLNRNITAAGLEDLQDREELRAAGRAAIGNKWSIFGAAVINLTNKSQDPTLASNGFQPLRTRLGIAYSDDCIELGVTWRRDYVASGDARKGNTFQLHIALKNLGF